MDERYRTNTGAMYSLKYHFVWCPKYRYKVLIDKVEKRLRQLLQEKAKERQWQILALEIMPDHVHIFIECDTSDAPAFIANQLKGFTSRFLRKEFAHLSSRMPCMWSRSYYVGSVGTVSEKTVKKYIENQKGK